MWPFSDVRLMLYSQITLLQPGLKIVVAHFMHIYIVGCVTALKSKNRPHPQNPNPRPLHPSVYDAGLSTGILEWYHKYSLCCSMDFVRFLCNTVPYIMLFIVHAILFFSEQPRLLALNRRVLQCWRGRVWKCVSHCRGPSLVQDPLTSTSLPCFYQVR